MKKLGVFLLSFFMCAFLFAPQMSLSADGGSPKLTVKTNKSSYELREPIDVTVQMENKTTTDMDDVQISLSNVKGLENTSDAKVNSFATVPAGDKVTSSFQMKSKEKKQREGIVFKKSHIVKKLSSATFKNSLNYSGTVTYTSSNTKVATVASDGTVTLVGPGEGVIITATIPESDEYYEYSTSFTLDVYKEKTEKKAQTLKFEKDYIAKWKEDKNFVNPLTQKGEGSGKITYYSSNPYVAFINPDTGEVDIKHTGKVTITAYKASDETYKSATASYTLAIFNTPVNTGADTSDSNTGLYIGLGVGAVIIAGVAIGLSRKKAKKILMSLLIAAAMGVTYTAPKEIKAAEEEETQVVTASTKVTVDGQEYTISVECQYVPVAAEQQKEDKEEKKEEEKKEEEKKTDDQDTKEEEKKIDEEEKKEEETKDDENTDNQNTEDPNTDNQNKDDQNNDGQNTDNPNTDDTDPVDPSTGDDQNTDTNTETPNKEEKENKEEKKDVGAPIVAPVEDPKPADDEETKDDTTDDQTGEDESSNKEEEEKEENPYNLAEGDKAFEDILKTNVGKKYSIETINGEDVLILMEQTAKTGEISAMYIIKDDVAEEVDLEGEGTFYLCKDGIIAREVEENGSVKKAAWYVLKDGNLKEVDSYEEKEEDEEPEQEEEPEQDTEDHFSKYEHQTINGTTIE